MPHHIHKCTNTLYDYAIINFNTYVSLTYKLKKNCKGIYGQICWEGALVLYKKNLPGRGLTKIEKHRTRGLGASKSWSGCGYKEKTLQYTLLFIG